MELGTPYYFWERLSIVATEMLGQKKALLFPIAYITLTEFPKCPKLVCPLLPPSMANRMH